MTTIQIIMLPIACAAAIVAVAGAVVTWRAARQLRLKQRTVTFTPSPRERCGDLAPPDGVVCEAYRLPTTAEDSGLCARCGMSDYKHWEPRHA